MHLTLPRIARFRSALFILSLLMVTLYGTGCTDVVRDYYPSQVSSIESLPQTVRVVATVTSYPTEVSTRVDDGSITATDPTFQEQAVQSHPEELRIDRALLYVLKATAQPSQGALPYDVEKVIQYTSAAKVDNVQMLSADIKPDEKKAFALNADGRLEMELDLVPGDYTFVVAANYRTLPFGSTAPTTRDSLRTLTTGKVVDSAPSLSPHVLPYASYNWKDPFQLSRPADSRWCIMNTTIPMVGAADLVVGRDGTVSPTSGADGVHLNLEKAWSRLEVTLTTVKSPTDDTYLGPDVDQKHLLSFGVHFPTLQTHYMLPTAGEYTRGVSASSGLFAPVNSTVGSSMWFNDPDDPVILNDNAVITGDPLEFTYTALQKSMLGKLAPNDPSNEPHGFYKHWHKSILNCYFENDNYTNQYDCFVYYPSLYIVGAKDEIPEDQRAYIDLVIGSVKVVKEIGIHPRVEDVPELHYRLYLHNEEGAKDYYSLRRNTVYRFDLKFVGSELEVTLNDITYKVEEWVERPVDLPPFD